MSIKHIRSFGGAAGAAGTITRVSTGKVLADNFDDNSLDPAWTYEEGVVGNSIAEVGQRLSIAFAQNSYAHVQRAFTTDNVIAICQLRQVTNLDAGSWSASLGVWFNGFDWIRVALINDIIPPTQIAFAWTTDVNETLAETYGGAISLNTWYYVKIRLTATTVYVDTSTDGRTWTNRLTLARPATWTIDASSLLILGSGFEWKTGSYANPDWDNNYSSTGSDITTDYDDLKVISSEVITMTGLPNDYYFKIYDGSTLVGTSGAASGGSATLDISGYEDLMPFDFLILYDSGGVQVAVAAYLADVWGGDSYIYA